MQKTMVGVCVAIATGLLQPPGAAASHSVPVSQTVKPQTATQAKLDSRLRAALAREGGTSSAGPQRRSGAVDIDRDGKVLVDIQAAVTPELVAAISGFGGVVITKFPEYRSLRARLPLSKLEALAERADVKFVRAAEQPVTNPTASEAR
jgi:hypothetical protein